MNRLVIIAGLGVLVVVLAARAGSATQSLAAVARQEEARRKAVKAPSRLYTNEDLHGHPSAAQPGGGPASETMPETDEPAGRPDVVADEPAPGGATGRAPETGPAATGEAYWRDRMAATRAEVERQEVLLEALQSRVNALTADFVNRDDPAQRALLASDRERALAELERVTAEIERLKTAIGEIEEEARQAGVPPGWLR